MWAKTDAYRVVKDFAWCKYFLCYPHQSINQSTSFFFSSLYWYLFLLYSWFASYQIDWGDFFFLVEQKLTFDRGIIWIDRNISILHPVPRILNSFFLSLLSFLQCTWFPLIRCILLGKYTICYSPSPSASSTLTNQLSPFCCSHRIDIHSSMAPVWLPNHLPACMWVCSLTFANWPSSPS